MSILNVNKINPVGGGSTITIAGIASVTNNVLVGDSNLHSTGLALGVGSTIGAVTGVTTYYGDGSQLTGTGPTFTNGADNRVVTATSASAITGEANLTFNGGETGDAQLTVHAAEANANSDSELILETSNDFATSVVMFKDSTAEAGSIAYNHGDNYIKLSTNGTNGGTERVRIDSSGNLKFDSGYGSVNTAYGVRAWIAFKAAGGSNTVRGSGNATITDHGTGDFTMNFTTAMPDTGYSMVGTAGYNSGVIVLGLTASGTHSSPTTSGFRFTVRANYNNSSLMDEEYINLIVVR